MLCYTQEDTNAEGTVLLILYAKTNLKLLFYYKYRIHPNVFFFFFGFFLCVTYFRKSTGEILYRVELPYMEEITLIYLEDKDNLADFSKF